MNKKRQQKNVFIHKTACIDKNVIIGSKTKIWNFAHILRNSRIGKSCIIGQNVSVGPEAIVGNNCKIQNNVSIYKGVILEDGVFCGPSCVFTNVINPRAFIERKDEFLPTLVSKGATLGANSTIICGNTIGEYAFVGAGAVVTDNVLPYALVYGNPARHRGWVCQCGIKLSFKRNRAHCASCGRKYGMCRDKTVKGINK